MTYRAPAVAAEAGTTPHDAGSAGVEASEPKQNRVPSADLFRGAVELEIVHGEQVYRLRQTALGKLILTK